MLGSLTLYRRLLLENIFSKPEFRRLTPFARHQSDLHVLPSFGHGIAGIMAGTTVSFIAAPVEHVKARLQIQYAAEKSQRLYSGPIDCVRKMVSLVECPRRVLCENKCETDNYSSTHMASPDCTAVSSQRSSSDRSFSSGGVRTMSCRGG